MTKRWRLDEIAQHLEAELVGDGSIIVGSLAPLIRAKAGQITFLSDSQYLGHLSQCQASGIVLTQEGVPYCKIPALVVKDPYISYAQLAQLFDNTPKPAQGIDPSAVIAPDVKIGSDVSVGANTVIESGVILGDGVIVGAGCFIGCNTQIGSRTTIWANVTIYHEVFIGKQCLIQANTVIGSDGFGYANQRGHWIKIPQLGSVRIGDNVEIGASTTIDRGALDDTIIGNGVIIDNQCQVAHNVTIGDHTAIAGGVVMAGSLKLGCHCMVGGASVINGHMTICDNVTITGMSMVMRPISEPGVYSSGIPLQPNKKWRKTTALVLKIDEMNHRLKQLEKGSRKS